MEPQNPITLSNSGFASTAHVRVHPVDAMVHGIMEKYKNVRKDDQDQHACTYMCTWIDRGLDGEEGAVHDVLD